MAKSKRKRKQSPLRQLLNPRRIAIPIVIGLAVATYLLVTEVDFAAFSQVEFGWGSVGWLLLALLTVVFRDFGYMLRLRILSGKAIRWRNVFDDIMLWEFSSAITPSVVGGSGVAIFILNKEGLSVGKSTAVVMTTAFLDELFYVLMVPLLFLLVGTENLFPDTVGSVQLLGYTWGIQEAFWLGYGFILLLISVILIAIFIAPVGFKRVLVGIFHLPLLRRWKRAAVMTGNEIIATSKELKTQPFSFWLRAFTTTSLSWTARYLTANFLLLAFTTLTFMDNLIILARQLVMWVIMLISPTPGGEGVAQLAFENFLSEYTPIGLAAALAILWRLYTYYPYLFLGALILPQWIQRVYLKRKLIRFKAPD
ncbi:MAG: flippase-like domain-containing protein [Leptolyngbya sp. SIO3F4]|nr:flippase-like domain-containing protein [Leptolyngbya sp. SIO3F4]